MRIRLGAGVLLSLLVAIGSASAGPNADSKTAKRLAERGFDSYDEGDYEQAISLFEKAHEIAPADGLLFNIAQSYRQLGESGCGQALVYYRRYKKALIADGSRPPKRLRTRISEMKECADAIDASGDPATADLSVPNPLVESAPTQVPLETDSEPRGNRTAGWTVLGVGVASLAISATTGLLANGRHSILENDCNEGVCAPSLADEIRGFRRLRTTAVISGGIGLGAIVAGTWLLLRSGDSESAGPSLRAKRSVEPWIGIRSVGVQCTY